MPAVDFQTTPRPLSDEALDAKGTPRPRSSRRRSRPGAATPRRHRPYADTIDSLDPIGGVYHHEGPFDATLAAVNQDKQSSPLEAVKASNRAALRATPRAFIRDSLRKHVPLQGTAVVPPGMHDLDGRLMVYEEGADLMREPDAPGGAYRRWEGRDYHPDDLKGKGEPSYSMDKAEMRDSPRRLRKRSASSATAGSAYEMTPSRRGGGGGSDYEYDRLLPGPPAHGSGKTSAHGYSRSVDHAASSGVSFFEWPAAGSENGRSRSSSGGSRGFADGLKRRLGSLRRK